MLKGLTGEVFEIEAAALTLAEGPTLATERKATIRVPGTPEWERLVHAYLPPTLANAGTPELTLALG